VIRAIRCVPFLLLLAVFDAFAGTYSPFWNPYVEPTNPTDHVSIRWVAEWDGCGALGPPSVSRLGERLTVRWPIEGYCGVPLGGHALLDLGRLPTGSYTVHVVPCHTIGSFQDPCYVQPSPPDVSFTVTAAASVPLLGDLGRFAMALLLNLVGAASVQARLRR